MSNLNFRAGTFEGIANATVYDGLRSRTVPLGSRCTIQRGADPGVVEWLRDWAIAKHKRFADPRESAMLAGNHQENAVLDISNANAIGHWEKGMVQDSQNGAGGGADWLDGLVLDTKQEDVVTSAKKHQRSNTSSQKITDTTSATTTERECRNDNKDSASSAEGAVSSSVALIAGQKSETKGDLVSELKAQLRRERNRASAQRANLRKKAMNDALKRELKNSLERAGELRSREMFLRQENMRLRKLLAES